MYIKYFGIFGDALNQLIPLNDEGDLCKVEFKGGLDPAWEKIELLLIKLGGRPIRDSEQEDKLKNLYVQKNHKFNKRDRSNYLPKRRLLDE